MQGDLYDHASLVSAFKQVDVVISTIGMGQVRDQTRIVDAIKEADNVKVNNQNPLHVDQGNRVHTEDLGFRLSLLTYWRFWLRSEALIRIVEWTPRFPHAPSDATMFLLFFSGVHYMIPCNIGFISCLPVYFCFTCFGLPCFPCCRFLLDFSY